MFEMIAINIVAVIFNIMTISSMLIEYRIVMRNKNSE